MRTKEIILNNQKIKVIVSDSIKALPRKLKCSDFKVPKELKDLASEMFE